MRKSFKYRLYPNRVQYAALATILESHRALYNAALKHRRTAYQMHRVTITYGQQSAELKDIRREDEGLARCNFSSCQATLRRLDRAYRAFFRRIKAGQKPGYPRFKGRDRFDTVEFPSHGDGCRFAGQRGTLQGVGTVKVKYHRLVEGTIKTVAFKREAGRWFVVVSCDLGVAPSLVDGPAVGIYLGLSSFLVTSDGAVVAPPRFARKSQRTLRRVQRALARCRRGSKRRRKVKAGVARCHAKVANQRRDFHHKTARTLVCRYGVICVEDLNVIGIARSRLAKSTHDAGWAQFLAILTSKAEEAGRQVIVVDPRNTTQACSQCGALPSVPLGLSDRMYHCASCGYEADRDLNAARNILRRGHRRQAPTETMVAVA